MKIKSFKMRVTQEQSDPTPELTFDQFMELYGKEGK